MPNDPLGSGRQKCRRTDGQIQTGQKDRSTVTEAVNWTETTKQVSVIPLGSRNSITLIGFRYRMILSDPDITIFQTSSLISATPINRNLDPLSSRTPFMPTQRRTNLRPWCHTSYQHTHQSTESQTILSRTPFNWYDGTSEPFPRIHTSPHQLTEVSIPFRAELPSWLVLMGLRFPDGC